MKAISNCKSVNSSTRSLREDQGRNVRETCDFHSDSLPIASLCCIWIKHV